MKKNFYLLAITALLSISLHAQKTIIVNGGQFGNPLEDVSISIFDPSTGTSSLMDTIHSQSVQEILIDSVYAFVVAQDSVVKYNLNTEKRIAANAFEGMSTKSLAVYEDYLLLGNWYGQTSSNLYIYDRNTLALVDSVAGIVTGIGSILIQDSIALLSQNLQNSSFEDTLGYISRVNLNSLQQLDDLVFQNYTGDIGQLVEKRDSGFYAINSTSNTFLDFNSSLDTTPALINFQHDIQVSSFSQYSIQGDTLFMKYDDRIGSVDVNTFQSIDSSIVDTVVTAFAYDTVRKQFYVTQTDFFSYNMGGVYDRQGAKIAALPVGYSPEVISMFYSPVVTGIEKRSQEKLLAKMYPNPAKDNVSIELNEKLSNPRLKIYNMSGKLVMEKKMNGMSKSLNISNLRAGAYIVLLESDDKISTSRLIKQ